MSGTPFDLARLRAGDSRTIGQTLTRVENDPDGAESILEALIPLGARVPRIGITGPPGAGKSSLVAQLVRLDAQEGLGAGVLAVDPSSEQTGGAVLGDRVRMRGDEAPDRIFFRSVATRGCRGGLARTCADLLRVLAAAGKDRLYLETVGIGQTELEIADLADTVVLVLVPESGAFIQTLKAGVLEVADILVVNKSDREGADALAEELRAMQHLAARTPGAWEPLVLLCSARSGDGVPGVRDAIGHHLAHLASSGEGERRRRRQASRELRRRLRARVETWMEGSPAVRAALDRETAEIATGVRSPMKAAQRLWLSLRETPWT